MEPVADPVFELRRGPDSILLAQPALLPSVISSFFTQNKGGGDRTPRAPPLDPPLGTTKSVRRLQQEAVISPLGCNFT